MPVVAATPSRPAAVKPEVDRPGVQPLAHRGGLAAEEARRRAGPWRRGPVGLVARRADPEGAGERRDLGGPGDQALTLVDDPPGRRGALDVRAHRAPARLLEGPLAREQAGRLEGQPHELGVRVLQGRAGGGPLVQEEERPEPARVGLDGGDAVGPDPAGELGLVVGEVAEADDVPRRVHDDLVHALVRRDRGELVRDRAHQPARRVRPPAAGPDGVGLRRGLGLVALAEGAADVGRGPAHIVRPGGPRRRQEDRVAGERVAPDRAQDAFRRRWVPDFLAGALADFDDLPLSPPPLTPRRRPCSIESWSSDFSPSSTPSGASPPAAAEARLERGHQVDDRRGLADLLGLGDLLAAGLGLEELEQRRARLVGVLLRHERPGQPLDELLGHRELLLRGLDALEALADLALVADAHVLGVVERLEREHPVGRPQQHQVLLGGEHEATRCAARP